MTRTERLLRLARLRGDRAAELILLPQRLRQAEARQQHIIARWAFGSDADRIMDWTEAELRAAWGDR